MKLFNKRKKAEFKPKPISPEFLAERMDQVMASCRTSEQRESAQNFLNLGFQRLIAAINEPPVPNDEDLQIQQMIERNEFEKDPVEVIGMYAF